MILLNCFDKRLSELITDFDAADRIIDHLKLTSAAEKPPPRSILEQAALMAAEPSIEYL